MPAVIWNIYELILQEKNWLTLNFKKNCLCFNAIFIFVDNFTLCKIPYNAIKTSNMVMMIMMMNCFCGMVERRKAFSLISSRDQCQRSSPPRISDTPDQGLNLRRTWVQAHGTTTFHLKEAGSLNKFNLIILTHFNLVFHFT